MRRIIKQEELIPSDIKIKSKYDTELPLYFIDGIINPMLARRCILPTNCIWASDENNNIAVIRKNDILRNLRDPNIRFKVNIDFDDYYKMNNNYERENVLDSSKFKCVSLFDNADYRYCVTLDEIEQEIYEFEYKLETRIFLTDSELFSIYKIIDHINNVNNCVFVSLKHYHYNGERIWFLISKHNRLFRERCLVCDLSKKYFNKFNNNYFHENIGSFKYRCGKPSKFEIDELSRDLDLRPSEILKISPALFTITNYNNNKKYEEKEAIIKQEENINKELYMNILKDYYEGCMSKKDIQNKYETSFNLVDKVTSLSNKKCRTLDTSGIIRKRKLSPKEKEYVKLYNKISDSDKEDIIAFIKYQNNIGHFNIHFTEDSAIPGSPKNIEDKYDLGKLSWYDLGVLYSMLQESPRHPMSVKKAHLILQMI